MVYTVYIVLGCRTRTCDREIARSTPAAGAFPGRLGQLSLPSLRGMQLKVSTSLLAGVKAERVHLYRVAGNTV